MQSLRNIKALCYFTHYTEYALKKIFATENSIENDIAPNKKSKLILQ
jgi:hypothetical protein